MPSITQHDDRHPDLRIEHTGQRGSPHRRGTSRSPAPSPRSRPGSLKLRPCGSETHGVRVRGIRGSSHEQMPSPNHDSGGPHFSAFLNRGQSLMSRPALCFAERRDGARFAARPDNEERREHSDARSGPRSSRSSSPVSGWGCGGTASRWLRGHLCRHRRPGEAPCGPNLHHGYR